MGLRKHDDNFEPPVLSSTKAARIVGGILIVVGFLGIPSQLSGSGSVFFVFAGVGIILLSTSNDAMHLAALGSFGIALFSLGFALGQLLG